MHDCANATMRDLLPDLLHDRLQASVRAEVRAHVDACAACRAELELLRRVRAAAIAPRVDATRIAAAIPSYRPTSAWRRATQSPQFRIAAAIVLLAGGAGVLWKWTYVDRPRADHSVQVRAPVAVVPADTPMTAGTTSGAVRHAHTAPAELAVGETFQDLSDSDLRALLGELEKFEAVTPSETEIVLPSLGRSGT